MVGSVIFTITHSLFTNSQRILTLLVAAGSIIAFTTHLCSSHLLHMLLKSLHGGEWRQATLKLTWEESGQVDYPRSSPSLCSSLPVWSLPPAGGKEEQVSFRKGDENSTGNSFNKKCLLDNVYFQKHFPSFFSIFLLCKPISNNKYHDTNDNWLKETAIEAENLDDYSQQMPVLYCNTSYWRSTFLLKASQAKQGWDKLTYWHKKCISLPYLYPWQQ